ncbi:MAG TPA: aromatic amino acid hydroxylase, partial [Polyangiaceae bacterium]
QARGILPIAAEIRTREHLVYTPAPDIIHEAAGHAPILTDPLYAAYLRGVGELGQRAFTLPEEERVYQAIYALSEVKENPALDEHAAQTAEAELRDALAHASEVSEATRTSRLYWWTAEYGLVGRLDDYRLYGAGLLSSLWESHSCHDPAVRKLPLDESCTEMAYDITRPQPQLYVAANFEALHEVLAKVQREMAVCIGGRVALDRALASQEIATARFESGASVIGVLSAAGPSLDEPAFVEFSGPTAFCDREGQILAGHGPLDYPGGHVVLTGRLADGSALFNLNESTLRTRWQDASGLLQLVFASGARAEGRVEALERAADGSLRCLELSDARVELPGRGIRREARFTLLAAGSFSTAHAGALDSRFYPDTRTPQIRVPRPRQFSRSERSLLSLYEKAERAHASGAVREAFPEVHGALDRGYPTEWLLRWNLLESLLKLGIQGTLTDVLEGELESLERHFDYRQPIDSGLKYLRRSYPR